MEYPNKGAAFAERKTYEEFFAHFSDAVTRVGLSDDEINRLVRHWDLSCPTSLKTQFAADAEVLLGLTCVRDHDISEHGQNAKHEVSTHKQMGNR